MNSTLPDPGDDSPMKKKNIQDEDHPGPNHAIGGKYSIVEQMINKK